jgi:hypothetical protein
MEEKAMANNRGTASPEQLAELYAAVIRQCPRDIDATSAQGWIENQAALQRVLREALVPKDVGEAGNAFLIVCRGERASELIRQGAYDWHDDLITDKRFPIKSHAPVNRRIEFVEFDHAPTSEEVLAEFRRSGLIRPTYEDALYFGIQHKDEQMKAPTVFLHEPVLGLFGGRSVLVLGGAVGDRGLGLDWFDGEWARYYRFAGVRES